jgi:hypothetical protein
MNVKIAKWTERRTDGMTNKQVMYQTSKLSDNADDYDFAIRTFCSWDHTIFSKEGVKDHRKAFCTELR